jgi:acyl carrier protein
MISIVMDVDNFAKVVHIKDKPQKQNDMKEIEIREAGRQIVADTLGVSIDECTDDAGLEEDLGADSLDAAEILMAVETKYDITVVEGEADKIETVGDLLDTLVKKVLDK